MHSLAMVIVDRNDSLDEMLDGFFYDDGDGSVNEYGHFDYFDEDLSAWKDSSPLPALNGRTGKEVADAYRADEDLEFPSAVAYCDWGEYEWREGISYSCLLDLLDGNMNSVIRFVDYHN